MSDRRRNIFVLLVVVGLLIASLAVILPSTPPEKETKLGLDLQGGVQLVYEARPTKQQPTVTDDGLQRSLDIMRERVDQFGVAEPELLRTGRNQIEVNLPGVDDAERAARQVGTTAQLYLYDWEPNVLDEDCRTNPELVNGGQTPITGLYNAVKRASECEPQVDGNNTTDGPIYYAFDETSKQPLNDGIPEENREALRGRPRRPGPCSTTAEILEVPEGIIVTRNEDQREPEQQIRRRRRVVGAARQPGARRHRHPQPRAELRPAGRRRADRHDGVQRRGPPRLRADDRRPSPSAGRTTRRSTAACRTPSAPRTTSRSGSTTS